MTTTRTVRGIYSDKGINMKEPVTIRFTSDSIGESLSLQCKGTMIHVRYKDIERIVERERSRGYVTGHYITGDTDEAD